MPLSCVTFLYKKHTLIDIVGAIESALTMTRIAGLDAKKYSRNHHLDHLVVGVISAYWLSVSLFCSDGVVEEFPGDVLFSFLPGHLLRCKMNQQWIVRVTIFCSNEK